jgi:hypothetical protein
MESGYECVEIVVDTDGTSFCEVGEACPAYQCPSRWDAGDLEAAERALRLFEALYPEPDA